MDETIRKIEILKMLKRREEGVITRPEAKRRLGAMGVHVSPKTIERDFEFLVEHFKIANNANESSKPVKYWWGEDSKDLTLPSMSLHGALALSLAKRHIQPLLPSETMKYLSGAFNEAEVLLRNRKSSHAVAKWQKSIAVVPRCYERRPAKISKSVQGEVYEALYEGRQIDITYLSLGDKKYKSHTNLHPLALVYRGSAIELIAWKEGKDPTDPARFLLNRMSVVKILDLNSKRPKEFDLEQFTREKMGYPEDNKETNVELWIDSKLKRGLLEEPISDRQSIRKIDDGYILKAVVRVTPEFIRWVLGNGDKMVIVSPSKLKREIEESVIKLAKKYAEL